MKDHTYRLKKFFDSGTLTDVVPEGYVHTFLIRNPRAFVPSLYVAQTKGTSGQSNSIISLNWCPMTVSWGLLPVPALGGFSTTFRSRKTYT